MSALDSNDEQSANLHMKLFTIQIKLNQYEESEGETLINNDQSIQK